MTRPSSSEYGFGHIGTLRAIRQETSGQAREEDAASEYGFGCIGTLPANRQGMYGQARERGRGECVRIHVHESRFQLNLSWFVPEAHHCTPRRRSSSSTPVPVSDKHGEVSRGQGTSHMQVRVDGTGPLTEEIKMEGEKEYEEVKEG
jgi:hypothetical protein